MSKSEMLHELYLQCQDIDIDETQDLVMAASTEDEAEFINVVTDYMLQLRQRKVIAEKRF